MMVNPVPVLVVLWTSPIGVRRKPVFSDSQTSLNFVQLLLRRGEGDGEGEEEGEEEGEGEGGGVAAPHRLHKREAAHHQPQINKFQFHYY
jgi:hypothetical protein